jgi:hypothetical protein
MSVVTLPHGCLYVAMFGPSPLLVSRVRAATGRGVVFLVVLLVCVASVPTVTATGVTDRPGPVPVPQVSTPVPSEGNETTAAAGVRHRNPSEVREEGNVTELESHLSRLLATRLGDSIVRLDRGEYDRARQLVGPEYDSILDRYVSVSRERRGERESRFEEAGRTQREFVDSVAEYRQKREAYQTAKQAGDEVRARELARDLNTVADRSVASRDRLVEDYTTIQSDTGLNFTAELSQVEALADEIENEQAQIRSVEFFTTTLTLEEAEAAGSFENPIVVSGRVTSPDGTPEPFGPARFTVGARPYTTRVADDGAFEFAYRPTAVPVGRQTLDVAFVPRNDSVYLGSNTTMTATVEQSTPTVTVDTAPTRTAFGAAYRVVGRVTVGDVPVDGTEVTLWMGGTRLNATETNETGIVAFTGLLPAAVPAGDRTVRVGLAEAGRALAPTSADVPVVVEATGTALTLDADLEALESVAVSGSLTTTNGDVVARQPVDLSFDGSVVGTVVTDSDGGFETVLWVPPDLGTGGELTVEAAFDGDGTSLEPTRETDSVTLPVRRSGAAADDPAGLQSSFAGLLGIDAEALGDGVVARLLAIVLSAPLWSGGVVVASVVASVLAYRRRVGADATGGAPGDGDGASAAPTDTDADGGSIAVADLPAVLLGVARARLAAGDPVDAVEYSYLAARLWFVHARGVPKRGTHRQFLRSADADRSLADSERARLSDVTTRYERAVFSPTSPTEEDASSAIDTSASLLS